MSWLRWLLHSVLGKMIRDAAAALYSNGTGQTTTGPHGYLSSVKWLISAFLHEGANISPGLDAFMLSRSVVPVDRILGPQATIGSQNLQRSSLAPNPRVAILYLTSF